MPKPLSHNPEDNPHMFQSRYVGSEVASIIDISDLTITHGTSVHQTVLKYFTLIQEGRVVEFGEHTYDDRNKRMTSTESYVRLDQNLAGDPTLHQYAHNWGLAAPNLLRVILYYNPYSADMRQK